MLAFLTTSPHENLRLLWWLRTVSLLAQSVAILVVHYGFHIFLPLAKLWGALSVLLLLNGFTYWRLRQGNPVSEREFFLQMLIDILCLAVVLYYTGGASNPFTSLFILQVVTAAVSLPAFYSWMLAFMAIGLYTFLMLYPLQMLHPEHMQEHDFFSLHIQGMWINFTFLALLIPWFAGRMADTIRRQDKMLLESEQITAIATFAASAAHELGTPLATIAIIAGGLAGESVSAEDKKRVATLVQQVKRCKQIISSITGAAGAMRAESGMIMKLNDFMADLVQKWQQNRSGTLPEVVMNIHSPAPDIRVEYGLEQAIMNVLDNACEAGAATITLSIHQSWKQLVITIDDNGHGIRHEMKTIIGRMGASTRTDGLGMGLYLTRSVIARLGGSFTLTGYPDKGATALIRLPLSRIAA